MNGKAAGPHAETQREFGLGEADLAAWQESSLPDEAFEEWLVDRAARRPSGPRARQVYGATGLDHSAEMVDLARDRATGAEVVHSKAEILPFANATFTAVAMVDSVLLPR